MPDAFDKLIPNWASPKRRSEILAALADINAKAGGFAALSPDKRLTMLETHDRASRPAPIRARFDEEPDKGGAGSPGFAELKKAQGSRPTQPPRIT